MAQQHPAFTDALTKFAHQQHIFFVATAAEDGRVNLSPKGMDSLRILGPNRLIWRNLTGSGNETAGHLKRVNRMTVMWCGFEKLPMILRAYGTARALHERDADFATLNAHFAEDPGARQVYDMTVEMVQTSCGYAVPHFDYAGERPVLHDWAEKKGPEGIRAYWDEKNRTTIDGFPTDVLPPTD
ncbi:pyridoxamine 5'-phosphate oxidase family protein [Sagittula sp. S175]|uniref:pyridoxamine 5'-phosphate oxidase family protein n=1 Tax=Sagittula sp. S175 TaxID=3415129 RepID=UPI003C798C40